MRDLVEFLRARLDEDEAVARRLEPDPVWMRVGSELAVDNEDEIAISAGRVLREVEAKRRIVDEHPIEVLPSVQYVNAAARDWRSQMVSGCRTCVAGCSVTGEEYYAAGPCMTLRLLAAVYDQHPDYREEWRV